MRRALVLICAVLQVCCFADHVISSERVSVGFVVDGPWDRNYGIVETKRNEIRQILEGEFEVVFPDDASLSGEYTTASIAAALDSLFLHPGVNIIIASGPIASQIACMLTDRPKPVIAPYILDAAVQGIPMVDGTSGTPNLVYVAAPWNTARDLHAFHEIYPFEKLALLGHLEMTATIPGLSDRLRGAVVDLQIELQVVPVTNDIPATMSSLDPDVDAVYITGLRHLTTGELQELIDSVNARKLPSFSLMGRHHVEMGVLAGLMDDVYFERVARRVALIVQRIVLGEDPATIPVAFTKNDRLVINAATMRQVDVSPGWGVLTEAEMINPLRTEDARRLTLAGVMRDADAANRDLAALAQAVEAGKQVVNQAWSVLFPQIDVSARGVWIDPDRAEASMGLSSEHTLSAGIGGTQVIISEPAWAGVSIQKSLQRGLEAEYEARKLDVAQATATAYLNTLRATTFEEIQRENLRVTRSNLDMARVREALGTARAAEVLRWESQLAGNRANVIHANAARNLFEIELNRLLDRPLEASIRPQPVSIQDRDLLTMDGILFQYTSNPGDFKNLRTFLVSEALASSPELGRIDAGIAAQERLLKSTGWSFIAPQIGLFGDINWLLSEGGVGSDITLPIPDGTDWTLGFEARLPLFEGGARLFERKEAARELNSLNEERISLAQRIEQRTRSALHVTGASHAAIRLARDAERTSLETLELVTDAYGRGAASIIDLIDAQNAALVSSLAAANAEYDFLIDLMEVERSLGRFVVFMPPEERAGFFNRLNAFFTGTEE